MAFVTGAAFLSPPFLLLAGDGVAFAVAARRLTLAALGMLQYISPTLQFLLGVFVLHEPVDAQRLAGFAAVWLGLLVFSAGAYRRHRTRLRHANAA